jgi:formylglycine-generating enzyme required for sulfatase activity
MEMKARARFFIIPIFAILALLPYARDLEAKLFRNTVGMEFELIRAGSFVMGALLIQEEAMESEAPRHLVNISKSFYMGKFEVTQGQWEAVMGNNPSLRKGKDLPVEYVSWFDAQEFIEKLNRKENTNAYRLPTEAEWEYAARGGTNEAYFFGDDHSDLKDYAWYEENSEWRTHEVGLKKPNNLGLYDIYGNVREWVSDRYDNSYYKREQDQDPRGPEEGDFRVSRGCSWIGDAWNCRSASREPYLPHQRSNYMGFRLAFTAVQ